MHESTYGQSRIRNAGADSDRRATPRRGRRDGRKDGRKEGRCFRNEESATGVNKKAEFERNATAGRAVGREIRETRRKRRSECFRFSEKRFRRRKKEGRNEV